jgi:peptidoglycan/xylan/chitin deacetylase (PgdA/CDA1 family)
VLDVRLHTYILIILSIERIGFDKERRMSKPKSVYFIWFLIMVMLSSFALAKEPLVITDYHSTFIPGYDQKKNLGIAIRMYYIGATPYFLVVNPYTFATETLPAVEFAARKKEGVEQIKEKYSVKHTYFTMQELEKTPYLQALKKYTAGFLHPLQNDGITHAEYNTNARFLTADMCPSVRPFEKNFFQTLVAHQTIPIALSISGLWMIGHPDEFKWLIEQEEANTLSITWINHSFSHLYYPDLVLSNNFLLTGQTDFSDEILETEKLLLQYGQLPSVFFRFPGLVSDKQLIHRLREFGLIPVGANAWLAKGQPAKPGSIILVHGNGNEPQGIEKVMPLLSDPTLHFAPLSQAFKTT